MTETPAVRKLRKPKTQHRQCPASELLPLAPKNELSALASRFVTVVEIKNPKYDISAYLPFAGHVLPRLGVNNALDAAVNSVVFAHSSICSNKLTPRTLISYGQALKALRKCLDNPVQAVTVETLIAIFLILVCQGWIDNTGDLDGRPISHGEVLAHLLHAAANRVWTDEFEVEVLLTMTYSVLYSSMFNSRIKLDLWFAKMLNLYDASSIRSSCDPIEPLTTLDMRTLARISAVLRAPETHPSEAWKLYALVRLDCERTHDAIRDHMEGDSFCGSLIPSIIGTDPSLVDIIGYYRTTYGLLLSLSLILNAVLRTLAPYNATLVDEDSKFAKDLIKFGQHMAQYRPLGASFVPMTLCAVIAVTANSSLRKQAEDMVNDYATDFPGFRWVESVRWLETTFNNLQLKLAMRDLQQSKRSQMAIDVIAAEIRDPGPPPGGGCFIQ